MPGFEKNYYVRETAPVGPSTYDDALEQAIAEIRAIALRRHKRYGQNLLRHGEFGIIVRVDDKTERIKNMIGMTEDDAEEPRVETWMDIAGYALQAILIEREQFSMPMRLPGMCDQTVGEDGSHTCGQPQEEHRPGGRANGHTFRTRL